MKHTLTSALIAACILGVVGCGSDKTREAAELGDADAQVALGHEYRQGSISDWREGVIWFRKAADQGHEEGQCNLGLMILRGTGVRQDSTEAARWLVKAAEQGNADAQFTLGQIYDGEWASENNEAGTDVAPDPSVAEKWYRMAADQGHADAKEALDNR